VGGRRREDEHEADEPGKAAIGDGARPADQAPQARDFTQGLRDEPPLFSLSGGSLGAVDEPVSAGRGLLVRAGLVAVRAAARL
jgi:hypothetical protein